MEMMRHDKEDPTVPLADWDMTCQPKEYEGLGIINL